MARISTDALDARCNVSGFVDPGVALHSLRTNSYDLVVSDLLLPTVNGLDFLRVARAVQRDAIRLVITGHGDLPAALAAINDVQVYRFIPKPWNDIDLQQIIVTALQMRKARWEDRHLADEVRVQRGDLSADAAASWELEAECPGITHVERDDTGAIVLRDE